MKEVAVIDKNGGKFYTEEPRQTDRVIGKFQCYSQEELGKKYPRLVKAIQGYCCWTKFEAQSVLWNYRWFSGVNDSVAERYKQQIEIGIRSRHWVKSYGKTLQQSAVQDRSILTKHGVNNE